MLYYTKPYLTIEWDEKSQSVIMEWKGFVCGADFRDAVNKGLELLVEKRGAKWMADLTHMGVIAQEDQKWADEDWFPRAAGAGLRFMAMVRPERVLAQMSVRRATSKVGEFEIETDYFSSPDLAKQWLGSK